MPRIVVMGCMSLRSLPVSHREKDCSWLLRILFRRKMESRARCHYRSHSDRDKRPWHIYGGSLFLGVMMKLHLEDLLICLINQRGKFPWYLLGLPFPSSFHVTPPIAHPRTRLHKSLLFLLPLCQPLACSPSVIVSPDHRCNSSNLPW